METENPPQPSTFTYLGRTFTDHHLTKPNRSTDDVIGSFSSSAFFSSEFNSDRSGELFSPAAASARSHRQQLWLSSASVASSSSSSSELDDQYIRYLISGLHSSSVEDQKQATMEIRLLSKHNPENRLKIARSGAIGPLISLISSSTDLHLQEYCVTAILNPALCDANKELITDCGAIKPLVRALRSGTMTAKENAACALLRLSQVVEEEEMNIIKATIGRSGAIPPLVNLLASGGIRGKKDASTALYSLCSVRENKVRAVEAGIMRPLVELMADFGSSMVDKAAYLSRLLATVSEGSVALVEEAGIPVLVELLEVGSKRQKEVATAILLQLCEVSVVYQTMVARVGTVPPLVALSQSQSDSSRAKKKAERLIEILRQPRCGGAGEEIIIV